MKLPATARFSTVCIHAGQDPTRRPARSSRRSSRPRPTCRKSSAGTRATSTRARRTRRARRSSGNIAAIEGGSGGVRVCLGHGGDRRHRHDAEGGRSRRRHRQHLRRHVSAVRQGADALRAVVHLRRHVEARRCVEAAMRPETRMLFLETPTNPVMRLTDIAARRRDRAPARRAVVVDNTFASPCRPAADRVRRRSRRPQHDQVPERPQRQRRRHRHRRARRRHRVAEVHSERRGRDPQPVRFVAGAARHEDARAADGAAQRQRPGARRVPRHRIPR